MAYSKGRATGYTDYYKNNSSTPGGGYDDEEEHDYRGLGKTKAPIDRVTRPQLSTTKATDDKEAARKTALRRRLQIRKARM